MTGQTIHYHVVNVVYQRAGRGKQKPITMRARNIGLVTRAKTVGHINRDKKALDYIRGHISTTNPINLRVYEIVSTIELGKSLYYKEEDYKNEFG